MTNFPDTQVVNREEEIAQMEIIRSEQSRKLAERVLVSPGNDEPLQNASFMLSQIQIDLIKQLAKENRYMNSQGAILRFIIDDWARMKLRGCGE